MKDIYNIIDNLEFETEEDKEQIKRASKLTDYTLINEDDTKEKICRKKAIEILGKELYVSGLERSAFHWTAFRTKDNIGVLFDSSKLFKESD